MDHIDKFHPSIQSILIGPYCRRERHGGELSSLTLALWALAAIFVGGLLGFIL